MSNAFVAELAQTQQQMDRCKTPEKYSNTQLVPCRWKRTGWKYIQTDNAANNRFFYQQHRLNS